MSQVTIIAFAVVLDAIRRKVVWVVLLFAALMALVIPSLPSYGVGVVDGVFREVAIALTYAASFVVAMSLSATRIPAEIERRTVFNVLARDVRRWHYIVGTWLGMLAVLGVVVLLFSTIVIVVGAFAYQSVMLRMLAAGLAVWLEMGVLMAFAIMLSARFGVVTTAVGTLVFAFVGHSIGTLFTGGDPHASVPWYVPSLDVFNVINPVAHGTGYGVTYAAAMIVVFLALSSLLLLAGSTLFARRDL